MLSASLLAGLTLLPTTVRAQSHIEPPPLEAAAPTIHVFGEPIARPSMLAPLYVSLASLQAYDGYTTLRGVNNGAHEANALDDGHRQRRDGRDRLAQHRSVTQPTVIAFSPIASLMSTTSSRVRFRRQARHLGHRHGSRAGRDRHRMPNPPGTIFSAPSQPILKPHHYKY